MKATKNKPANALDSFEELISKGPSSQTYILRLYVSGSSPQSLRAIHNIKKICEENFQNRYSLEVIDLYQSPNLAKEAQLVAAPTLIKELPLPLRRIIGDMSNTEKVLIGLDFRKVEE